MSKIEIKDLYLIFGNEKQKALKMLKKDKSKEEILKDTGCTVGVKDANLSINEGEFFVIMGLSGSGKSTLLRCINRLIRPTAGQVLVNGVDISKISEKELLQVRRKELAMVFQNFGLLPHRSVLSNIAFGLELQGVKKEERYGGVPIITTPDYDYTKVKRGTFGECARQILADCQAAIDIPTVEEWGWRSLDKENYRHVMTKAICAAIKLVVSVVENHLLIIIFICTSQFTSMFNGLCR